MIRRHYFFNSSINTPFQSIKNLTSSALATGKWLKHQGLEPDECIILNSLPLHHISGFMPWWRHQTWQSEYHWISHSIMHKPLKLRQFSEALTKKYRRPLITSLVPTQLLSLIDEPDGLEWLQSLALIWVGEKRLIALGGIFDLDSIIRILDVSIVSGSTEIFRS